jgi:hypothetical protein
MRARAHQTSARCLHNRFLLFQRERRTIRKVNRRLLSDLTSPAAYACPKAPQIDPPSSHLGKGQSWPVDVLKGILREAVLHLQQDHLVLIIDALDECLEKDIRDMVRFLEDLITVSSLHGVTLWICLASRHYPTINTRFCESLIVEAAYDHTRDIREYAQDHLNVEPIAHRSLLSDQMVRRSGGVFLWVTLVVRNINEAFDQGETQDQLQDHISKIPDNLNLLIGKHHCESSF